MIQLCGYYDTVVSIAFIYLQVHGSQTSFGSTRKTRARRQRSLWQQTIGSRRSFARLPFQGVGCLLSSNTVKFFFIICHFIDSPSTDSSLLDFACLYRRDSRSHVVMSPIIN